MLDSKIISLAALVFLGSSCRARQHTEVPDPRIETVEQVSETPAIDADPEPTSPPTTEPERVCETLDALRVIEDLDLGDIDPLDIEIMRAGVDLDDDDRDDIIVQAYLDEHRKIGIYIDPECPTLIGQFTAETIEVLEASHHDIHDVVAWTPDTCETDLGGTTNTFSFNGERYELTQTARCPCDIDSSRDITCPQP